MSEILKSPERFTGCDFVVQLGAERKGTKIKLLQLTDMQFIDSHQRRTPDRLRTDEINAWHPDLFDANAGNQIRSLVSQVRPDLIFITGDIIYGSFDDNGTTLQWFCNFLDSFKIPWAPVWGNHDNESKMGVTWQCDQFSSCKYCMFERGNVSGNSNYTVGIACGDKLVRVMHMLDSNGCHSDDSSVISKQGLCADQLEMVRTNTELICSTQGQNIPSFMAFHIPTEQFAEAEFAKGYRTIERDKYTIGVDVEAKDDDFGCNTEGYRIIKAPDNFNEVLEAASVDGIFVGHCHAINTCITYNGVRYVYGLKTGQYDYHNPYQLGGTCITLEGDGFEVSHVPALAVLSPMPGGCSIFNRFFAEDKSTAE